MTTLHIIGQKKGGVGKSTFSIILSQLIESKNVTLVNFDNNNNSLGFFDEKLTIENFEMNDELGIVDTNTMLNKLSELATKNQNEHIILDLGAATFEPFFRSIDTIGGLDVLVSYFEKIHIYFMTTASADSFAHSCTCIQQTIEKLKTNSKNITLHLVKNHFFGKYTQDQDIILQEYFRDLDLIELVSAHPILQKTIQYALENGILFEEIISGKAKVDNIFISNSLNLYISTLKENILEQFK